MTGFGSQQGQSKNKNTAPGALKINGDAIFKSAINYHAGGDLINAEKLYRKAIDHGFSNSVLFSNLGVICITSNRMEEAVSLFMKAMKINPKDPGSYINLGNIYRELDEQMNMSGGIGEYDMRYIRTIVDCMGEYGNIRSLGPQGMSGRDNPSILAGMSIQYVKDILAGGATMGNKDPIKGVTESIVVGKTPKIGDFAPE